MNQRVTKPISILIFLFTFSLFVFAQDDDSRAQTFSGTLAPGAEKTFKVEAKKGQIINAKITSEHGNVMIAEEEGAYELTAQVPGEGYDLVIVNGSEKPEAYQLTVSVTDPLPPPAEKIEIAEGETEKTISLTMNPYKLRHRFSIELKKGWTFKVSTLSREVADRLIFLLEEIEDADQAEGGSGTLWISAGRDAVFYFQVEKEDESLLEGELLVQLSRSEKTPAH